jgi:putative effector of murein hydrolase
MLRLAAGKKVSSCAQEAEACFQTAISIARAQGTRSVELQIALSLAQLWQGQGKLAPAREVLTGILGSFTEGFDTVDWCQANTLLADLS